MAERLTPWTANPVSCVGLSLNPGSEMNFSEMLYGISLAQDLKHRSTYGLV
jgi:hypothetical protein